MHHFANRNVPVLRVHESFLITSGLFSKLLEVIHKEFEKMSPLPIKINDNAKVTPISFPIENVDVD